MQYSEELHLLKHGKNYLSGKVFLKGLGFITLPILTRLLTPDDFGIISLYRFTVSILIIIFSLSINTSISRYYFEENKDFDSFLGFHLIWISLYILLLGSLLLLFSNPLSELVGIENMVFKIAILVSGLSVYTTIYQSINITQKKSVRYSLFQTFQQSTVVIASIVFISTLSSEKYLGRVYGDLIIVVFSLISIYHLIKNSQVKLKKYFFSYSARIAFPSVPGMLAGIVLVQIDRLFINHLVGVKETGLYSYAYTLGMIIVIISSSIISSWEPRFFELMNQRNIEVLNRLTMRSLWFICTVAGIIILFASEISTILAPAQYQAASSVIPIVILSYIINDHSSIYGKYVLYDKRYIPLTPITVLIAGALNIFLNYKMIPIFGYKIAVVTTLLSYISVLIMYYGFAMKAMKSEVLKMKISLKPYSIVVIAILIFYFLHYANVQVFQGLLIKLFLLLLIIVYKIFFGNENSNSSFEI